MGRNTYGTMAVVQAEVAHDGCDMDEPSASRFTQLVCNDDASLLPEGCRSRHHHLVVRLRAGPVNCGRVIDVSAHDGSSQSRMSRCALDVSLWTGKKPTKRTFEMLCFFFCGMADEDELLAHLNKLKDQDA